VQGGERPEAAAIAHLVRLCTGPDRGAEAQLAAAEAAMDTLWSHLARLMGEQGAQAVFGQATRIAQRRHPLARRVRLSERHLDFAPLKNDPALLGDDVAAVIETLASALVEVVAALIGLQMLEAVLGDVELALARRTEPSSQMGGAQQEDPRQQPEPHRSPDSGA
jgi:hypothetical protein